MRPGPGNRGLVPDRAHYIDRLKILAVAAVFLIHVSEVFNPWDEWHITAPRRSRVIGEMAVLFAPWIMPLLMLLAGMTAFHALEKRGNRAYLLERTRSLLVPLVVGVLTVVPPQVYLERRFRGQFEGGFAQFYPHFFQGIYPTGNLSWHHLWFLAHLFLYAVVALPLFRLWQRDGSRVLGVVGRIASMRHGVLLLAAPLIAERMLLWGVFPERHMLAADWSNHAILVVAYLYGFALAKEPAIAAAVDAQWRDMLTIAALSTICLFSATWAGLVPDSLPSPYTRGYLAFWTLYAVAAWAWVVGVLGAARRWLDRPLAHPALGRRAYIWYVVHQPLILAAAYLIVRRELSVPMQFTVIFLGAAAGTLLGSEAIVGLRTLGGRLLRLHRPGFASRSSGSPLRGSQTNGAAITATRTIGHSEPSHGA